MSETKPLYRLPALLLALLLPLPTAWAQAAAPADSGMDATTLYNSLHAEMLAAGGQLRPAAHLMLGLAKMEADRPELFERAAELALQGGDTALALKATQAWTQAEPQSADAARYALQLHLMLGQTPQAVQRFGDFLRLSPAAQLNSALVLLPALLASKGDGAPGLDAATSKSLEGVLLPYTQKPAHAAVTWATLASLRQHSGAYSAALTAACQALTLDAEQGTAAWVLLDVLLPRQSNAAELGLSLNEMEQGAACLERYAAQAQLEPGFRMRYSAYLVDRQRLPEALAQVRSLRELRPESPRMAVMEGLVLLEMKDHEGAQKALDAAMALLQNQVAESDDDLPLQLRDEALLALALLAQERGDFAQAHAQLDQVSEGNAEKVLRRRAVLLSREGRWEEAVKTLRQLPQGPQLQPRQLLMAEVQILNEAKQYPQAQARLQSFVQQHPDDGDALYMLAMLDERLGQFAEMERRLREVMRLQPQDPHAFNALGYTLADRNERLDEAKTLIEQALALKPGDPMMLDSLGWVEFRLGHLKEAHQWLGQAYAQMPDPEVAAHLGEVLWAMGEKDKAKQVWRDALAQDPEHKGVRATVQRLGAGL